MNRDAFRQAFDGFDLDAVCAYKDKLAALAQDPGIIRNRRKIQAAVNDTGRYPGNSGGMGQFFRYLWHWTDGQVIHEAGPSRPLPCPMRCPKT